MSSFLKSRLGLVCLCAFAALMAVMFIRVLNKPIQSTEASPPQATVKKQSTKTAEAEDPKDAPLADQYVHLERLRDGPKSTRTEHDNDGLTVTKRRTAAPVQAIDKAEETNSTPQEPTPIKGGLRLEGRQNSTTAVDAGQPKEQPAPTSPEKDTTPVFVPFGRPIRCELVFTIDSCMEETPLIGLVVEPVYNNGELVIPPGTEIHGIARPDRLRDRIFSTKDWVLVFPRSDEHPAGRQLAVKGLVLDRIEPQPGGLTWGITDGSYGLQGDIIRTLESEQIKKFVATFLSASALTLQERNTSSRGTRTVANTPANAALQGIATSLEDTAKEIAREIEKHGVFIRVPGGKQFYFYPQQSIVPARATLP